MSVTISPPSVFVKDTCTPKGRAVFAGREFDFGELLEESPVTVVRFDQIPDQVKRIVFNWESLSGGHVTGSAIALGYGSLYNHSLEANLRYEADAQRNVIRFITLRRIERGEELTINYNSPSGRPDEHGNHWFGQMKIAPFE